MFIFGPPDFFADFLAGIFSPQFCGKKCPEKSSRKIPEKILQNLYNKNPPTHFFLKIGRGNIDLKEGKGYQNRAPSLLEPRVVFLEFLEPRLEPPGASMRAP